MNAFVRVPHLLCTRPATSASCWMPGSGTFPAASPSGLIFETVWPISQMRKLRLREGAMFLQLLLLLTLLGPGSSLQLITHSEVVWDYDGSDYYSHGTDFPGVLETRTEDPSLSLKLLNVTGTSGQRDFAGPETSESATLGVATRDSAVLYAGAAATGILSTELATQGIFITRGPLTTEPLTVTPPITEGPSTEGVPSTELATVQALSTGPAGTLAPTTEPAATEALSTGLASVVALTTEPAATEALTTGPASMVAPTTEPAATEALTTGPASMVALTTEPAATEALSTGTASTVALTTEPAATEALTTGLASMVAPTTEPAATDAQSTEALSTESTSTEALTTEHIIVKSPSRAPTVSPSPTEGPLDHNPVKQCLLAILILALVATVFLVCTVVLAIRLSRKNHTYPVRNYSPTEMVCISSLLPEGAEGSTATANGGLSKAKSQGLKAETGEDREGDDLTLHSFLP
ncbi:P-selectin glycoprotein ligand 1 isoform X1 [Camelus ferus]|uniref:P-selectin glycoprotein ligand 1 isoform X1 n=2 Tax=Camelus ferus TaxID=419612 RepID=A0A8B7K4J4_CAMFR|nr:P-selectin glycoprotein ligand 1 isoform X1 [Camelus ferus]XP_032327398.1 P-selectin glycoprotein ligand 1 isoform X1 [Camelus ferus]